MISMSKQPDYCKSTNKFVSRKTNMYINYLLTGRRAVRGNQQVWTLCNLQDNSEGSEIVQYIDSKFCRPEQLFGVDNDSNLIDMNKMSHPKANWIPDDWYNAIRSVDNFNPGFIYLDTILRSNNPAAARMLIDTMQLCGNKTVIVANFCANNPRCGSVGSDLFDKRILIDNIMDQIHNVAIKKWNIDDNFDFPCISYLYSTSKTIMRSYIFYKGRVDSRKIIREIKKI